MRFVLFTLAFIAYCSSLQSQLSYTGKGKLNMADGTAIDGEIQFKPAYSHEVEIRKDSTEKYKKYTTAEVKSFEMDTLLFEPRKPKGGEIIIGNKQEFMEVVVKSATGLNMYIEHYQDKVDYFKNIPLKRTEHFTFYVSVPDNTEEAYDLNSFKFIPKFDDKVGKILEACPALAEKVKNKEKGYFYNMMNQKKAPDIWADIILEYKKCVGGN